MKLQGFPEKLYIYTLARRDLGHLWGINDCVMFVADGLVEITGNDPLGDLRGTWSSEAEAMAVLDAQGGLIAAMDARFPRRELTFAQRGDVVMLHDVNGMPSLALVVGVDAAAPGEEHLMMYPMSMALLCWEV